MEEESLRECVQLVCKLEAAASAVQNWAIGELQKLNYREGKESDFFRGICVHAYVAKQHAIMTEREVEEMLEKLAAKAPKLKVVA